MLTANSRSAGEELVPYCKCEFVARLVKLKMQLPVGKDASSEAGQKFSKKAQLFAEH